MNLPDSFTFSQHNLQDYCDCPQRFLLRHVRQLDWPAVQAQPVQEHERRMDMGSRFHRMVQQHLLGIPAERLTAMATDPDLLLWWSNYLQARPADLPGQLYPELLLAAELAGQTVMAKLDLLVAGPDGSAAILDWKTDDRLPRETWLAQRMQTRIYRLLVYRTGARFFHGSALIPEQITFLYWYAGFPESPFRFPYTSELATEDETLISGIIHEILDLPEENFLRTDEPQRCRFCVYRSYCERGVKAGSLQEGFIPSEEAEPEDWSFDQIPEIEF